jgi:hypothetical protein
VNEQGRGRQLKTQFAIQADDLASSMNASMKRMRIAPADYVPELTAPEGVSTGGGKLAMQRLRLVPQRPGFPVLVVGSANMAEGTAELRSFAHADALHRQQFKKPVALDRAQYDQFIEVANGFMIVLRLRTTIAGPPSLPDVDMGQDAPRSTAGLSTALVILALVLIAAGGFLIWLFVLRGRG